VAAANVTADAGSENYHVVMKLKTEDIMRHAFPVKLSGFVIIFLFFSYISSFCDTDTLSNNPASDMVVQPYSNNAPFVMDEITAPVFPARSYNIRQFGAVGDGQTMNTNAINQAIQACAAAGGGKVVVPDGLWLTGPVILAANTNLYLEPGAVIIFSRNFNDYPLAPVFFEGIAQYRCQSPITGENLVNIAITGQGIIDGSGDAWRPVKKFKMTSGQWKNLQASGGVVNRDGSVWWPTAAALNGESLLAGLVRNQKELTLENVAPARDYLRPVMVRLVNCSNVLLDGPTFQNSPSWNIHPLLCENVIIRNLTVRNPWYSQNGDGLDLESCKNVLVYNNWFDVGDDAICLKSGKDREGRERGRASENIIIRDCTVFHGHGGVTVGSEMSGGIRNIFVNNCTFIGTDVGLRFKSLRGRGGVVEKIYIHNVRMLDIPNEAVLFDLFYENDSSKPATDKTVPAVSELTPFFRDIHFNNIFCRNAGTAIFLNGLPELPLHHISFDSVLISSSMGVVCSNVEQVNFSRVTFITDQEPVFHLSQCRQTVLRPSHIKQPVKVWAKVNGAKSASIYVDGAALNSPAPAIIFGDNAPADAVIFRNWRK